MCWVRFARVSCPCLRFEEAGARRIPAQFALARKSETMHPITGSSLAMLTPTATGDNVPTTNVVEWVCARAAANRSVSRCKPCEWFQLDELHRQKEPSPVPSCIPGTAKLAWFVCLTPGTDELALGHLEYAQVAIMSALINAPSLAPHVILVRLAGRRDRLAR